MNHFYIEENNKTYLEKQAISSVERKILEAKSEGNKQSIGVKCIYGFTAKKKSKNLYILQEFKQIFLYNFHSTKHATQ